MDFKCAMKNWWTDLFLDKSVLNECAKFYALWTEYLSLAIHMLQNSAKVPDLIIRDIFKLNLSHNDEKIG